MLRLALTLLIAVFVAQNAFAGETFVNSVKVPVTYDIVMPDQAVTPYIDFNKLVLTEVDEMGVKVEKDLAPKYDYLQLDGFFNVHTKVTPEIYFYKPEVAIDGFRVEGTITSLGAEAYSKYASQKYLIKGDYKFSGLVPLKTKGYFTGIIPFKMVDANSHEEFFVDSTFNVLCTATGCTDVCLSFDVKKPCKVIE